MIQTESRLLYPDNPLRKLIEDVLGFHNIDFQLFNRIMYCVISLDDRDTYPGYYYSNRYSTNDSNVREMFTAYGDRITNIVINNKDKILEIINDKKKMNKTTVIVNHINELYQHHQTLKKIQDMKIHYSMYPVYAFFSKALRDDFKLSLSNEERVKALIEDTNDRCLLKLKDFKRRYMRKSLNEFFYYAEINSSKLIDTYNRNKDYLLEVSKINCHRFRKYNPNLTLIDFRKQQLKNQKQKKMLETRSEKKEKRKQNNKIFKNRSRLPSVLETIIKTYNEEYAERFANEIKLKKYNILNE